MVEMSASANSEQLRSAMERYGREGHALAAVCAA
jgi:hypothetical protein